MPPRKPKTKDFKVIIRQLVEVERLISLPIPTDKEMKEDGAKYPDADIAIEAFADVHPEQEDFSLKNARTFIVYNSDNECIRAVSR